MIVRPHHRSGRRHHRRLSVYHHKRRRGLRSGSAGEKRLSVVGFVGHALQMTGACCPILRIAILVLVNGDVLVPLSCLLLLNKFIFHCSLSPHSE